MPNRVGRCNGSALLPLSVVFTQKLNVNCDNPCVAAAGILAYWLAPFRLSTSPRSPSVIIEAELTRVASLLPMASEPSTSKVYLVVILASRSKSTPLCSVVVRVRVTEPLQLLSGVKTNPSSALLISETVPVNVIAASADPSPEVKVRPVVPDKLKTPSSTLRTISRLPVSASPSLTEIKLPFPAEKTRLVSSLTVCGAGVVLTGAANVMPQFWRIELEITLSPSTEPTLNSRCQSPPKSA